MSYFDTPTLENEFVRLEALHPSHHEDLVEAVRVDELWKTWYTSVPSPESMAAVIEQRLAQQESGALAPWAIVDRSTSRAVGMTTYLHLDPANRRLEIGSTWLGRTAQGTGVNPAAKLLLLSRAFEELQCIAVEFRTHWHNHQSRAAIERLGAKQDGVLRNHILPGDGTVRDTVVFSIIDNEWATVKRNLRARLRHGEAAGPAFRP